MHLEFVLLVFCHLLYQWRCHWDFQLMWSHPFSLKVGVAKQLLVMSWWSHLHHCCNYLYFSLLSFYIISILFCFWWRYDFFVRCHCSVTNSLFFQWTRLLLFLESGKARTVIVITITAWFLLLVDWWSFHNFSFLFVMHIINFLIPYYVYVYIYNVCHWESLLINQCLVLSFSVCN